MTTAAVVKKCSGKCTLVRASRLHQTSFTYRGHTAMLLQVTCHSSLHGRA